MNGGSTTPVRRPPALALLLFLPLSAVFAQGSDRLIFKPPEWSFGTITDSEPIQLQVTVRNEGAKAAQVCFISTCDCLFAPPVAVEIAPRGEQEFALRFDPAGYEGPIDKHFIVRTTAANQKKALFRVFGEVKPAAMVEPKRAGEPAAGARMPAVKLTYFYSPGCRSCERFLSERIPALEAELGIALEIQRRSIFEADAYEEHLKLLERMGEEERAYPALVAGNRVLQGEREIEANLREAAAELAAEAKSGAREAARKPPALRKSEGLRRPDLAALPVLIAGLLDGINPCAFTTLIFLISALAVAGRSRREVLILGLLYTASVFVTYFLIGLGFLSAVRYAQSFTLAAAVIRWILVAALTVFAALSFHDYLMIRRGKTGKVLLQLPSVLKRQIHASIRARTRSAALAASALVLGFLVTLFELACTGQVYLPTIVYTVRAGRPWRGYGYLLLYNLGFIAPLLAVFGLSFAGLGLKGITVFFQKSLAGVKLAMMGLFIGLAVLTILI